MGLKITRKILCVILSCAVAVSTMLVLASFVLNSTLGSQSFYIKNIVTSEIAADCEAQLDAEYEALAVESGIPARVFQMVKNSTSTMESLQMAVENLFSDESADLYSQNKVEYFYNLCTEYLEGNGVAYSEASVRIVAEKAARIYSDCVGIHNADMLKTFIPKFSRSCSKTGSAALVVIVGALILMCLLYSKRENAFAYTIAGIVGGAIATTLGSVISIIAKVGSAISVSPIAYQQSFIDMTRKSFLMLLLVSFACVIAGGVAMFFAKKQAYRDEMRRNTRFSKIIGRL